MAARKTKSRKIVERELSVVEKFYIQHNCKTLDLETICKDINNYSLKVKAFLNECLENLDRSDTIDKLMNVNSKSGYAVMTKEASEKGDATKKRGKAPDTKHIHKIRPDK